MAFETVKVRKPLLLRLLPFLSVATFFLVWEFAVSPPGVSDWRIPSTLLTRPSDTLLLAIDKLTNVNPDGATLGTHAWVSMQEAFTGYILALLVGIPLGLLMGWFSAVRGLARPIFELVRPIPPIAWIPLTIFWFGIGLGGKVFIIWISGIVPCVINAYIGVGMTNPVHIQMARTFGASDWKIFTSICIPSALPMVFGALQIALAYCWVTLVGAELLASDQGLGFLITMGRNLGRTDIVILGMVSVGLAGAVIGCIIDRIESKLLAGIRR
ncbi:ABC-type nitrate/sulfonate/bicarbonate transport system, permease component [Desulfovibrio sp. DV]|uniref:ABC transporter permease n=1 Tax=Desulfovibrio sp. DV TaxID=1844708 RepID=UPI00094B80D1|nr:ABC transporter permease [Desulfovibrio sp. DV]OLN28294.1 ABC-type nitrate/sulfonate/bicarbonate transport system, permease component [Desulfovibrio sp. DV]